MELGVPLDTVFDDVTKGEYLIDATSAPAKPACSSLNLSLIASSIRPSSTLQNTLLGTDRRVMPLQLSQTRRSPFFGSLTIRPLHQASGMVSSSHTLLKSSVSTLADVSVSALSISACMLSISGAFSFSSVIIAARTSSSVGKPTSIRW